MASLKYSLGERPYDIGLLVFLIISWVFFLHRTMKGWRVRPWTKQTQGAIFGVCFCGLLIFIITMGIVWGSNHGAR
jgi:hypothetical protein